jgi:hypothetical protein
MNGAQRRNGTMLTAQEVAAASGGAHSREAPATPQETIVRELDYPQNPAGPVTTESTGTLFNRK